MIRNHHVFKGLVTKPSGFALDMCTSFAGHSDVSFAFGMIEKSIRQCPIAGCCISALDRKLECQDKFTVYFVDFCGQFLVSAVFRRNQSWMREYGRIL